MDQIITSLILSAMVFFFMFSILGTLCQKKNRFHLRMRKLLREKAEIKITREGNTRGKILSDPLKRMLFFVRKEHLEKIEDQLALAGLPLKAEEYLAIWFIAIAGIPSLILFFEGEPIVGLGFACLGGLTPPLFLSYRTQKRRDLFSRQLVDGMSVICNSLKTGFTLQVAIRSVAEELPQPLSGEFRRMFAEVQCGVPLERAMEQMMQRTKCKD